MVQSGQTKNGSITVNQRNHFRPDYGPYQVSAVPFLFILGYAKFYPTVRKTEAVKNNTM